MSETAESTAEKGVHVLPVRVYYEDTDAGGIVYYANYLKYAERARTEMLRGLGLETSDLMAKQGLAFAVRRCSMDFLKPAKLDDLLEVETRVVEIGGASLIADQRVRRAAADLVRIELKLACISLDGLPARLPAELRTRLEEFRAGEWPGTGDQSGKR